MIEIIPSINASTWEEAQMKIHQIEPYVSWAHLDISDGTFTPHFSSWHNFRDLIDFKTRLNLELHLMIDRPDEQIGRWLLANVKRVIVHQEVTKNPEYVWEKCHEVDVELGLSIASYTPWTALEPYINLADMLQILAVIPGRSGQIFGRHNYYKIANLRKFCKSCIIEVDGGVNSDTAPKCVKEGANILVAGHAIFSKPDIGQAIEFLKKVASLEK